MAAHQISPEPTIGEVLTAAREKTGNSFGRITHDVCNMLGRYLTRPAVQNYFTDDVDTPNPLIVAAIAAHESVDPAELPASIRDEIEHARDLLVGWIPGEQGTTSHIFDIRGRIRHCLAPPPTGRMAAA